MKQNALARALGCLTSRFFMFASLAFFIWASASAQEALQEVDKAVSELERFIASREYKELPAQYQKMILEQLARFKNGRKIISAFGSSNTSSVENRMLGQIREIRNSASWPEVCASDRARLAALERHVIEHGVQDMPEELVAGKEHVSGEEMAVQGWRLWAPVGQLRKGDLVFRTDEGFFAQSILEHGDVDRRFTHVGVISEIDGDSPMVIHAEPNSVFDAGGVKRASWSEFFANSLDGAVYRCDDSSMAGERIAEAAMKRLGCAFDVDLSLRSKNKYYCSELVRAAVNEAVGREVVGTSRRGGFEYVAIDDCYRNMVKVFDAKDWKEAAVISCVANAAAKGDGDGVAPAETKAGGGASGSTGEAGPARLTILPPSKARKFRR